MYTARELVLKRAFDVGAATIGAVAAAPLLAATALLVKASSPGPVVFRQERIGKAGRPFELWKFRTMRVTNGGPLVTAGGDPRVTKVGRLLRRTKLDELPQLFNVLRGDLSLVGPRPEVARYVDIYPPADREFLQRFKPGITDPATVYFRNEEEILARADDPDAVYRTEILPKKLRLYREYLDAATFLGDLGVLFQTLRVILLPHTAPDRSP